MSDFFLCARRCSTPDVDGSMRWRDDRYVYEAAGSDAAAEGEGGDDGSYSGGGVVRGVLACAAEARPPIPARK